MNQKIPTWLGTVIISIFAVTAAALVWLYEKNYAIDGQQSIVQITKHKKTETKACAQDAKQCSDGSYVSRTGTNCEFAACPEVKNDETVDWNVYSNIKSNFELKYPNGYKYIENNNYGEEPEFVIRKLSDKREFYTFGIEITSDFLGGDPDKFKNPDVWESEQNKLGNNYAKIIIDDHAVYVPKYDTKNFKEYIFFIKNRSVYDMWDIYTNQNDSVGEKIFSTFKFTK